MVSRSTLKSGRSIPTLGLASRVQINRRDFLQRTAASSVALSLSRLGQARSPVEVGVAIAYERPGPPVAEDFIGLSYESALLTNADYFSPDNQSVCGLLRGLGSNGVLRIGGNTSERTFWRSPSATPPQGASYVITLAAINALAALLQALNWRLIYGLNLARGTPEAAADEAEYVARATGQRLLAFQIGNEPDGFGKWSAVRPPSYDVHAFIGEWRPFHAAIRARLPDAKFAGPATAGDGGWIAPFADSARDSLVMLTQHYYSDGPAGATHINLPKLLHSANQVHPILTDMGALSRKYGLPYRIAETNSIFAEGHPGVSDTFGACLWGLELMFQIAAAGGAGINFHTGDAKAYTPIGAGEAGRHRARPLYYGMLMFKEAVSGGGAPVPTQIGAADVNLAAYAVRARDGTLRVCLMNKDLAKSVRVSIDAGRTLRAASVTRLTADDVSATTGVALGGASVDDFGGWMPKTSEILRPEPDISVNVPAISAALVTCAI